MLSLSKTQRDIMDAEGHLLVTGGPGSGKTTISILKAAALTRAMEPWQSVLFLSFARATVARVMEAIQSEADLGTVAKRQIDVETYHAFFWRFLKAHGYLIGLPRRLSLLVPPSEAVALADIRRAYPPASRLDDNQARELKEHADRERERLMREEGRVCFDLFAPCVADLLHGSVKLRELIATKYPVIILDEFQDTNREQWRVVQALGQSCKLLALADPEQRIFEWLGADLERLDHFRTEFTPTEFDLSTDNHRSPGTDIAAFGNAILRGEFDAAPYRGIAVKTFHPDRNRAYFTLALETLAARGRLIAGNKPGWTLAILVPTRRMSRLVSDSLHAPLGSIPPINHSASLDIEGAILAAELIAFLLEPDDGETSFASFIALICAYFAGRGGDSPNAGCLKEAAAVRAAYARCAANAAKGRPPPANNITNAMRTVFTAATALTLTGDPDADWRAMRAHLETGACPRLREIANDARNVRLLDRGTQLRQALGDDWRRCGAYANALMIVRQAFVREHFASAQKLENGIIVMNMHKAKGKQFDEVIIFEGWPLKQKGVVVSNHSRIARNNAASAAFSQDRQNFRVSVTRARLRTKILTPNNDPCALLAQ